MNPLQGERAIEFIGMIGREIENKERHNGYTLRTPANVRFGYVRFNNNGTCTVYAYLPFEDLEDRFVPQPSNHSDCRYTFEAGDDFARRYALSVLVSSYDSK